MPSEPMTPEQLSTIRQRNAERRKGWTWASDGAREAEADIADLLAEIERLRSHLAEYAIREAVAEEREACAKIIDDLSDRIGEHGEHLPNYCCSKELYAAAEAIRAR